LTYYNKIVKIVKKVQFVISDDSSVFRGLWRYFMASTVLTKAKAKTMSVSFKPDMFQQINDFCDYRGCTRSWFMNKAAELYLNECLEDKADYESAVGSWNEYEKSGKTFSADEVREELGL
jgi:hypothetical protein